MNRDEVQMIKYVALKELEQERFRLEVEKKKAWLKLPLWKRLFPWTIQIKRREDV